jgi:hypothetical protein
MAAVIFPDRVKLSAKAETLGGGGKPNDETFLRAMQDCFGPDKVEQLFAVGPRLAAVIPQFASMDGALHFLSAEPETVELGKLAITHEIMKGERNSKLYKAIEASDPGVGDTNNTRDIDPVLVDGMKALDLNGRLAKRTFVSASIHSVMLEFDIRWAGRTYRNLARWCRDFPD